MTRIGFAYNQKPEVPALRLEDGAEDARPDEEPPSSAPHEWAGEASDAAGSRTSLGIAEVDDEFAEWDSAETIAAVEQALAALGDVIRLEANADFPERLRAAQPDIVFNIAEGLGGANREAHVPAICEFFGFPYSGSDPFSLSLCLDKARTKEFLAYHGVPTAPFALIRNAAEIPAMLDRLTTRKTKSGSTRLRLPLFVKPVHEGSSKGITEDNYCRTVDEAQAQTAFLLERYAQPVLVEEYLPGREFTCAVMGNGDGAHVLPIVAMNFDALPQGALPVYGFEAKWLWDDRRHPLEIFECPARIDEALRSRIEEVVLSAYHVLGCRDWSRIDVRLDAAGVPNVVEVNPLPGILPNPEDNSCFPKAARAAGLSYDELIQRSLRFAAERQGIPLSGKAGRRVRRAAALG
ncbi:MAG: D-alanine--D-alanine ligase [Gemmatimonadales bacterium]|jgi:D-alanine-D-alanine ligase